MSAGPRLRLFAAIISESDGKRESFVGVGGDSEEHAADGAVVVDECNFTKVTFTAARSANVIAVIEGSDPELKHEYVVISAHLDHLGIGPPVNGDAIYNGALDNAAGAAVLIESARAFSAMQSRPKRSVMFLATTGEEAGLLGSSFFTSNPTVPLDAIVADINIDGPVNTFPGFLDIIGIGAEHSTLGDDVQRVADQMHILNSPDPMPDEVFFIRSDQYPFVAAGIPAVFFSTGYKSSDPSLDGMKVAMNWFDTRYHQPNDDMQQPDLDFDSAAKFAQAVVLCGLDVADNPQRPHWMAGDVFTQLFPSKN